MDMAERQVRSTQQHEAPASLFPRGELCAFIQSMKTSMGIFAVLFALAVPLSAQKASLSDQFQEARQLLESKGDYPAALKLFESIANGPDRNLAARSLLYLGYCYERLGNAVARQKYQKILDDFPEERALVAEAKKRLTALATDGSNKRLSGPTVRVLPKRPVGVAMHSVSPDGHFISYGTPDGNLGIFELATDKRRMLTSSKSSTEGTVSYSSSYWSPDSQQIVYGWQRDNPRRADLRVIGLDGSEPRILYEHPDAPWIQPRAWSPDGQWIAGFIQKQDRTYEIVLISVADGSKKTLRSLPRYNFGSMSFSPDGRYLAYCNLAPGSPNIDIYLLATDGSGESALVPHPAQDVLFGWVPQSDLVLFRSNRRGNSSDAYLIQVIDGKPVGQPRLLWEGIGKTFPLGFADGASLYCHAYIGNRDIYLADLDPLTGKVTGPLVNAVLDFEGHNEWPEWSPDGRELAYISSRTERVDQGRLCVRELPPEIGNVRELAPEIGLSYPRWSADGRSFLALGGESDRSVLYQIDAQSGAATVLKQRGPNEGMIAQAEWSPDGRSIYFHQKRGDRWPIVRRQLDTGREEEVLSNTPGSLAFSPDGRWMAFRTWYTNVDTVKVTGLNVMPVSGGEPREIFNVKMPAFIPALPAVLAWSKTGTHVLFIKWEPGGEGKPMKGSLWRVPATGGDTEPLGIEMDRLNDLRLHPDGRRIAFSAGVGREELRVLENILPASATTQ